MERFGWFGEVQRERWAGLIGFVDSWCGGLSDGDGVSEGEIEEAEGRLGVRMPEALWEWYRIGGKRDDLVRRQNRLLGTSEIYVDDGHLVCYAENQGVVRWGVPLEKVGEADPIIEIDREYVGQQSGRVLRGWLKEGRQLSVFVYQMVVLEVGMGRETTGMFPVKVSMYKKLQRLMRKVEMFWSYDWPKDPTYFFADAEDVAQAELIVVDMGFRDLLVVGKDAEAFARGKRLLGL